MDDLIAEVTSKIEVLEHEIRDNKNALSAVSITPEDRVAIRNKIASK